MHKNNNFNITKMLGHKPTAAAVIHGSNQFPDINGLVKFYQTTKGVVIVTEIIGLPTSEGNCSSPIFAFHIHEGDSCTGDLADPFANTLSHFNPYDCPHPYHAGDMPPLFGVNGSAFSAFLTDRITVKEIIGRTVIIHRSLDDFTTQPSGNAGTKMACGVIVQVRR